MFKWLLSNGINIVQPVIVVAMKPFEKKHFEFYWKCICQCKWETYQGSNANYIGGNKFKKSENT